MARRGRPRKRHHVPPSLAEDPEQLAREAEAAEASASAERPGGGKPKPKAARADAGGAAGAAEPPGLPFPVEALALLHLELYGWLGKRLRSRYRLSEAGAAEMARYAELCIRQYLGPYLAEHAALAGYMMTQATALIAVVALREPAPKEPKPAEQPIGKPVEQPQYHEPVTDGELRRVAS